MIKELEKEYLKQRFYRDNIFKYHKYFEEWFSNLTDTQLFYFKIDQEKCQIL